MSAAETEARLGAPGRRAATTRNRGLRLAGEGDLSSAGSAGSDGPLGVSVMSGPQRTVVRPRGELDMSTVARMETSLRDALATEPPELVLDLHALEFCDAAGLQVFLRARRSRSAAGTSLWLERPTHLVRRVLEVSGLAWLVDDSATLRRVVT